MRLCLPTVVALLALVSPAAAGGFGDTDAAPRCTGTTELMAVVYNQRKPDASLAMIAGGESPRMVRIGSRVEDRLVVAILPQALWLGPAGSPCWIPFGPTGMQKVQPPPGVKPERKKNKNYKMKDPGYKMKK